MYKLPEYDLKVTAMEMGFLRACITEKNMQRMKKEMPGLYRKMTELIISFYKK